MIRLFEAENVAAWRPSSPFVEADGSRDVKVADTVTVWGSPRWSPRGDLILVDELVCGSGRDRAVADRRDRVARDCDQVRRS